MKFTSFALIPLIIACQSTSTSTSAETSASLSTQKSVSVIKSGIYRCRDSSGADNGYYFAMTADGRYGDSDGGTGRYTTRQVERSSQVFITWEGGANQNWNTSFYLPGMQGGVPVIALQSRMNQDGWICKLEDNS